MKKNILFISMLVCSMVLRATSITTTFVHTATDENTAAHITYIDHPWLNNNRDTMILVTSNWNPGGISGIYNNHNIGAYYNAVEGKWAVFNQDLSDIAIGSSFNIIIPGDDVVTYEHKAEPSTISGQSTKLDHYLLNNNPDALIQVTVNWNSFIYNDHPLGVWYNGANWLIFNQDLAAMPENSTYTIMIVTTKDESDVFVHTADVSDTENNYTYLDNELLNGNQKSVALFTQNWNPSNATGIYNNSNTGVWYETGSKKWSIFNQDQETMPENASFNTFVAPGNLVTFTHIADSTNISSQSTYLNHPMLNGNDSAIVFVTQNWNPQSSGGVYNQHPIGVWYTGSQWAVFNQDLEDIPSGAAFNVTILRTDQAAFVHKATNYNTISNVTYIEHPMLNNKSDAIFFASQNWNPESSSGVYNDHPIGVFYIGNQWAIFNQDISPMKESTSFNLFIPHDSITCFTHEASVENSSGNYTVIDYMDINNDSNAIILMTQNYDPNNVYNNHPVGIFYTGSRWAIFNQDLEAIPDKASFNIAILRGNGHNDIINAVETISQSPNSNVHAINIYPNPVQDQAQLSFRLNKSSEVAISILDQSGRILEQIENTYLAAGDYTYRLDVSHMATGTYICILKADQQIIPKPFLVK